MTNLFDFICVVYLVSMAINLLNFYALSVYGFICNAEESKEYIHASLIPGVNTFRAAHIVFWTALTVFTLLYYSVSRLFQYIKEKWNGRS